MSRDDAKVEGNGVRSALLSLAALLGLVSNGCSLYQAPVTDLKTAASIRGREVHIGYFQPASMGQPGDYVLLKRRENRWHVESVSRAAMHVAEGSELLYVVIDAGGALYVTPAYRRETPIDRSDMLFDCDSPLPGYGPCRSALVTETLPPVRRAGVNREAISRAIDEASVIDAIADHQVHEQSSARSRHL